MPVPIGWELAPRPKPIVYPKPELPAQKPKFVKPEIPSQLKERFFTGPEFEEVFGVKLPSGWDVSYTWDEGEVAPAVSVYAPGGVKLSLEDIGITPTGEWVYGERAPGKERFALPEGALPVEERLEYFRYQAQLRLEDILSEVFVTDEGVEEASVLAGEDPDAFLDAVAAIGRNDATEDLLREMGLTEEELDMVFGPVLAELPTKEPEAVFFPMIGQIKQLTAEQKEAAPTWVKAFASGVGDVYSAAAGAARWLGYDSVGQTLSVEAERMHREYLYPTEQFEYETEDLLNPDFWEQFGLKVARAVPFALALAPVSIGTYFGGAALATAAGLGTIWAGIVGGVVSGVLSRPIESALEAGTQYDDAIARGKTEKEAKEEADEVFRNNMVLAGADAFEIAIALAPTPKWVPNALLKGGLVRTARVAGKMVIVGLSEGGEEVYQDLISRRAKGEEWQWDPISKEVFAIGMVMGLGMGLGGDVITNIVNRSKETMPADMKKDFDESVKDFKKEGFLLDQAELRALDIISQSPKGQSIVAKAIDEVKRFITEERGAIGRPEVPREATEEQLSEYTRRIKPFSDKADEAIKKANDEFMAGETSLAENQAQRDAINAELDKQADKIRTAMGFPVVKPPVVEEVPVVGEVPPKVSFKSIEEAEPVALKAFNKMKATKGFGGRTPLTVDEVEALRLYINEYGIKDSRFLGIAEVIWTGDTEVVLGVFSHELDLSTTGGEYLVYNVKKNTFGTHSTAPSQTEHIANLITGRTVAGILTEEEFESGVKDWLAGKFPFPSPKPLAIEAKPPAVPKPPVVEEVKISPELEVVREGGVPVSPDEPIPQGVVKNIPIIQDIGVKERWVRPSRKVFERMDLYVPYKGIQRAEVELGEANAAFAKKLKAVAKTVEKSRRHFIFRELENPGSQVGLTFNEKRAVNFFRENFNKWADALNLPQEKRIKNYITHIFEADIEEQLKAKHPLDPSIARALEDRAPKTIFNPFLQERLGATIGLIEDPFAAALAYESRQLRVFYYQPFLQKIEVIANDPSTPQVFRDYLIDYSRRMTKQPSGLDKSINNTLREFAGAIEKLPGGKPFASFLTRGNPSGLAAYQFTGVIYTLWLGFKPTSAIRNLSQHTLIIGEIGPGRFAEAISKTLTAESNQAVAESLVMRSRKAAFVPGIDDSFVDKWTDKFREVALLMFRTADKVNVRHAFLGGYYEAKHLLPEADRQVWIDRGDEVAADTQYLYTQMNSMAISQSSMGRVFAILTTWSQNWIELMAKWITRRPSSVYKQYEKETGKKVVGANWSTSLKAIGMYMAIVGLGYALKEEKRLKAWEYTGITSIRYLADVVGGDFPGLQGPGAIANMIAGFLTDDERMMKTGWNEFKGTFTPGIVRQITAVANGDKDWLTLFFYLEGRDFYIKKLKDGWEKGWKEYEDIEKDKDRDAYRESNPLIEAQMFITGKFTTLSTEEARREVLRIIEANNLDTELIKGYDKVFGVDTDEKFTEYKKLLGTVELDEEGNQKLKENGELDYYTTSNFASDVNKLVKTVGRYKVEKDGNALAIAYLRAKDLFVQYDSLTDSAARSAYRRQFPDVEALMYLWGHENIRSFKNPGSAGILLGLLDKYGIPPESVPAFLDNPEKYDALFTEKFEIEQKWFDLRTEYDNLGKPESDIYIENDEERAEARAKLKEDNPSWMADMRRLEAFDFDATPTMVEAWVERGEEVDEFGAGSSEAKIWLIDHPDVHKWALDQKLLTDDGTDWNESVLRLDVLMRGLDEGSDKYRQLDYKKDAHKRDFPINQIDTYADWYMTKRSGYEDDWFLMENQDFYRSMVDKGILQERDFSKIPTREQAKESDTFQGLSSSGYVRDRYLQENKDFYKDVWLGLWGNKKIDFSKVPSEEVEGLYEDYFDVSEGGARLVFRHNNPEFEKWLVHAKGYTPVGDRWQAYPTGEGGEPLTDLEALLKELEDIRKGLKTRWPIPKNESIVTIYGNKPMTRREFLAEVKRLEEEEGYLPVPGGVSYGTWEHTVYSMKGAVNVETVVEIYDFIKGEALFYIGREQDTGKVGLWKREKYPKAELIPQPWPWEEYEERGIVPSYLPEAIEGKEF